MVDDQQVPIATMMVHRWQYRTNRDSLIPIQKLIRQLESRGVIAAECRPQFVFTWRGIQYMWNRLPEGWKHSPTICHGLIQTTLEQGKAPEHLQYIDDIIIWGDTAKEVFEKGERIIQILLEAGFAIK
ncbi:uncharacterized protein LOC135577045 isoform X2 [Columba livia]|uniref:uncharacterized protein LOC135577045 isoform X2 n=1 Tax=Columba livia TaxID=8932 RepID=UPI0031BB2C97